MSSSNFTKSDRTATPQDPGFPGQLDATDDIVLPPQVALSVPHSHDIRQRVRELGLIPGGIREDGISLHQSLVDFATFRFNMALRAFFHNQKEPTPPPEDWWK